MNRYEILSGLPPYGPMYVNIPDDGYNTSEGFAVRFYKSDGTNWVGNFGPGLGGISGVYDFPTHNRLIVLSNGEAYVVDPDIEKELGQFGSYTQHIIKTDDGNLICATPCEVYILNGETWELWRSERISWDGIKDLNLKANVLSGMSFDPTNSGQPWFPFTLNIETKEIAGGSYRDMLDLNPHVKGKLLG